jgi:tetratricopeptide (TPR) repeat protein
LAEECYIEVPELQITCSYELGWTYFLKNDFEHAATYFSKFLDVYHFKSFRAYAGYQLGYTFAILGDIDKAADVMKKVSGWTRKNFSFDAFASRKAREFLVTKTLSPLQRELVFFQNCVESLRLDDAEECFKNISEQKLEETGDLDDLTIFTYFKGKLFRLKGKPDLAQEQFESIVLQDSSIKRERYLIAQSLCDLGEIFLERFEGRKEGGEEDLLNKAKNYFSRAKKFGGYSSYDFDKVILRQVGRNVDRLKKLSGLKQSINL